MISYSKSFNSYLLLCWFPINHSDFPLNLVPCTQQMSTDLRPNIYIIFPDLLLSVSLFTKPTLKSTNLLSRWFSHCMMVYLRSNSSPTVRGIFTLKSSNPVYTVRFIKKKKISFHKFKCRKNGDGEQYFYQDIIFWWLLTRAEEWFTSPWGGDYIPPGIKLVLSEIGSNNYIK